MESLDIILGLISKDWCDRFGKYNSGDVHKRETCAFHIDKETKLCLLCKRISKKKGR